MSRAIMNPDGSLTPEGLMWSLQGLEKTIREILTDIEVSRATHPACKACVVELTDLLDRVETSLTLPADAYCTKCLHTEFSDIAEFYELGPEFYELTPSTPIVKEYYN
jgi:hypothetical protein